MKFTSHQKAIIKKIASGEITDIVSYISAFNLSTLTKLNKAEIEKRFSEEENGKTYKKLKSDAKTEYFTYKTDSFGTPTNISYRPLPLTEKDYEYVSAKISYAQSSYTVETTHSEKYTYDYFEGINIIRSFDSIKNFLIVWQYLKSEGLVLEVNKKTSKNDYEMFFEYKPINQTKVGKTFAKHVGINFNVENNHPELTETTLKNLPFFQLQKNSLIKDYRHYIDYFFEYNKANELICSHFIDKQIYGTAELDVFIKKGFKTQEQVNFIHALVPAYLALILSIVLAFIPQNNSDLVKIQNQLSAIQQSIEDTSFDTIDLTNIEKQLEDISKSKYYDSDIKKKLNRILKILKEKE